MKNLLPKLSYYLLSGVGILVLMYGLNKDNGWLFSFGLALIFASWFFEKATFGEKNEAWSFC